MPSYIKFETPVELVPKILDVISHAKESGKVRKGVNETTKSIERKNAKLVVIAEDVDPEEIVIHIPMLCEEKGIQFAYVKTKVDLGKSVGMSVGTSCIAVDDAGSSSEALLDILKRLPKPESKVEEKKAELHSEKPKEEKIAKPKTEKKPKQEKKK